MKENGSGMDLRVNPPPVLRQLSVRAVMEILLRERSASRAGLSRLTGLSKQTISEVIRVLAERGFVIERGLISGGVGRSAVRYEVDPNAGYVLGIDLGSTTIRAMLANLTSSIVAEIEIPSDQRGGLSLLNQIGGVRSSLLEMAGVEPHQLLVAAVATPGVMDPATGHLSLASNIAEIGDIDVAAAIRAAIGCPVIFENDINAAALGEYWEPGERPDGSFAFISLGTGVGMGILVNGKLLRGATDAAGEIAYLPMGSDPFTPSSLERGALECAIGAAGIVSRYRSLGGSADVSVRDIFDRFNQGEAAAKATIAETARLAALVVVAIAAVIDPAKTIFGGKIGARPELVALIRDILPSCTRRPIWLAGSRLGARATVAGATAIALGELHNTLFSPLDLPERMNLPALHA